jgi:Asp-tRNA(Asn)/Glu-tRNA(Gln) amidotransferase A subunit family amidase
MAEEQWQAIATRKRNERDSRIPLAWRLTASQISSCEPNLLHAPSRQFGILTDAELDLTENHDATSLLRKIAGGLPSEHVVSAFCKRAAIAQQLTNCLTEILFDDALRRARELDAYFASTGRLMGPLHGLPISLKDTMKIKGYDASLGIASLCFKPAQTNSALVDQLISLGAVIHCKTNVPQTMMALDSHNNVFGRTWNPANRKLTAGGSSGGEGALIAMRGSILGVGTDVGGSIRIPAACNNLYGIKPSHGRVPFAGQEGGGNRQGSSKLGIEATAGPLATTLRDCELLLRAISESVPGPETYDPEVIAQPWACQLPLSTQRPLRIGIIAEDGHVKPLPVIDRLLQDVFQTLRMSPCGVEVIHVDASDILARVVKTFNGIISIDGGNPWFDLLEATGEPLSPWLQGRLVRKSPKSLDQVRDLQAQKTELQTTFSSIWHGSGGRSTQREGDRTLDALILPVSPHPIPVIDAWNTVNYTAALNLLDLPAGVLPVRTVEPEDLRDDVPASEPLNGWDKVNRNHWTQVDRNVYLGSSLSVQVVTPRLTERRLVEVMHVLDKALQPLRKPLAVNSSKL